MAPWRAARQLFVRIYDLLLWLIPAIERFPRNQRPVLGRAVQEAALAVQSHLTAAGMSDDPLPLLWQADVALALLRTRLRLCYDLRLLSLGQYEHAGRQVTEVGRLLGGWQGCAQQEQPEQQQGISGLCGRAVCLVPPMQ